MSHLLICSLVFVPTSWPISAPTIMPKNPHEANKASWSHSFAVLFFLLRLFLCLRPREWRLDLCRLREEVFCRCLESADDSLAGSLAFSVFGVGFSSESPSLADAAAVSPEVRWRLRTS